MLDHHAPEGYRPVDVRFRVTRPGDSRDFRVTCGERTYHFRPETRDATGDTPALDGLTLVEVRDDRDRVIDTDATGTRGVPTPLVRALLGATYQYRRDDGRVPGPADARVIAAVSKPRERWIVEVRPGDGVIAPLDALLYDAAWGRLSVVTLRRPADADAYPDGATRGLWIAHDE